MIGTIHTGEKNMSRTPSKKLSAKVAELIRSGVDMSGSFDPDNTLFYFEERLTLEEAYQAHAFLIWVHSTGQTFGINIQDVYTEFAVSQGGKAIYADIVRAAGFKDGELLEIDLSSIKLAKVSVTEFRPRNKK
jgi:hypothetical protein